MILINLITKKKCSKCGGVKSVAMFCKDKQKKDGINLHCCSCRAEYFQRFKNEQADAYKLRCKKSREQQKPRTQQRYLENREEICRQRREYRQTHKDRVSASEKKRNIKRRSDLRYLLGEKISGGMRYSLGKNKNGHSWESLVGYTANGLKKHLEKQFKPGMTWENMGRGGWHIDHKIPISAFNFTKPEHEDFKRCWSLENLQPLWESENCSKCASLEKPFQPQLAFG